MDKGILPLYKKLLRLAQSLPEEKRLKAMTKIKTEFRANRHVTDNKEIAELLKRAQSSIGYLKIVTPRASSDEGVQHFVYKDGQRVEGHAKTSDGARHQSVDMNAVYKKHHQLIRRQYFLDRPSQPKPLF